LAEATVDGIGENSVTGFTLNREPLHAVVNIIAMANSIQASLDRRLSAAGVNLTLIVVIARILHVLWFACQLASGA
jgi:hypothetical protein